MQQRINATKDLEKLAADLAGVNLDEVVKNAELRAALKQPEREPIPTPTNFDAGESLETVWACLERLPDDALTDDERDNLNTAMAWITKSLGIEGNAQMDAV